MEGIKRLRTLLETMADGDHYLFSANDLTPVFQSLSYDALKMLLHRDDRLRHLGDDRIRSYQKNA